MADDLKTVLSDGFAAPLGDVIAAVGRGVAEAQLALDRASMDTTLALYDQGGDAALATFREIGYRPTFYALPETSCEVQISMRVGGSGAADGSAAAARSYVTPVDAGFANRFGYQGQASAKLVFKIVAVPPPAVLEDSRPVPLVTGRIGDAAAVLLGDAGFAVELLDHRGQPATAQQTAARQVLTQRPAALGLAAKGSTVTLTLDGRAPVPAVLQLSGSDAAAALQQAGFLAHFVDDRSAVIGTELAAQARVLDQQPSALQLTPVGEHVTLTVDGRLVPSLLGRRVDEAVPLLEKLAFVVTCLDSSGGQVSPADMPAAVVLGQDPKAPALLPRGSTVVLQLDAAGDSRAVAPRRSTRKPR